MAPGLQEGLSQAEELARLRAGMRFLKAFSEGRYIFQPASDGHEVIELRRVEDGVAFAFEPPIVLTIG